MKALNRVPVPINADKEGGDPAYDEPDPILSDEV